VLVCYGVRLRDSSPYPRRGPSGGSAWSFRAYVIFHFNRSLDKQSFTESKGQRDRKQRDIPVLNLVMIANTVTIFV
jgi:hypothetical protein